MKSISFLLIFLFVSLPLSAQIKIERGKLLQGDIPASIDSFFVNNQLDLAVLRRTTHFLTNRDLTHVQGVPIAKRKKAFMRHVKHISEQLECQYQEQRTVHPEMVELVYELFLLRTSLQQKSITKAQTKIPFRDKVRMVLDSYRSKRVFRYKIPEIVQHQPPSLPDSPYYHEVPADSAPHKQFGYMADAKKVDPKKKMVVLFKDLSLSGSAPKIGTMDLDLDNEWSLKWGDEVHTDVVGSRIFAALGYDVDHPYFYEKDKLTLVFDEPAEVNNAAELIERIKQIYEVDLVPFISSHGKITKTMAKDNKRLKSFIGKEYIRFMKCAIEARPDRVKRLGSFLPEESINQSRPELRGSLLAHHFIGNWDTREANTLLTTVHRGNYDYRVSAVFSDLGTSMGVKFFAIQADFKVGLVNELPWEVVQRKGNKLHFTNQVNAILPCFRQATYEDLRWMAFKIARLNEEHLRKIIDKAKWPAPIAELYFHKMASRRASILQAFDIPDPHPISFDQQLTVYEEGRAVIQNGKLMFDYKSAEHPESFFKKKGRLRNYGR